MRVLGAYAVLAAVILLAGCDADGPSAPAPLTPSWTLGVSACDLTVARNAVTNFYRNWDGCGRTVRVRNDPNNPIDLQSAITTAAGR